MKSQLDIVEVTGSTNDDLLKMGKEGAPHGYGLAARRQTAGRGRRGHKWDSTEGNLLLSIVLRPDVEPTDLSGLAAVCGLAVYEELEALGLANEVRLKWPNDLYARDKKLGGILIEAAKDEEGGTFAVAGIGVNVAYTPAEVPDGGLPAVSLMDLNGDVPPVDKLLRAVHGAVVDRVDGWARTLRRVRKGNGKENLGPLSPVLDEYLGHVAWLGREVIALSPDGAELARGCFKAVDDHGRALLACADGTHVFPFELASLRPLAH